MSRHQTGKFVETVPAVAGLIFTLAAAVQFLATEIYVGALDLQFAEGHAFVISLIALIVVFASSKTKNWEYYSTAEQSAVALFITVMIAHQFSPTVAQTINNQNPAAGGVIFMAGLLTWGVLAR